MQQARRADAFGRIHGEPELEIARVELLVRGGDTAPHAAPSALLRSCPEVGIHVASVA
jgi:hypothetical protein